MQDSRKQRVIVRKASKDKTIKASKPSSADIKALKDHFDRKFGRTK